MYTSIGVESINLKCGGNKHDPWIRLEPVLYVHIPEQSEIHIRDLNMVTKYGYNAEKSETKLTEKQ
jgi:hypothetical protein